MNDLLTLVINLDGSTDRLTEVDAQLRAVGLSYERFKGFDARATNAADYPEYSHFNAVTYFGRGLNGGEIGCYFSHLQALRHFLDVDKRFALVLEDDVSFDPEFGTVLTGALDILRGPNAPDWDALHFGKPWRPHMLTPFREIALKSRTINLCYAHLFPLNTHCVLWSREGAQAFLDQFDTIWHPVDHAVRYRIVRRGRGLCLSEAVAFQTEAPSEIDKSDSGAIRDQKESRWYRFNVNRVKTVEKVYALKYRSKIRAEHKGKG